MSEIIGAHHEFHDQEFVEGWADRFVPTPGGRLIQANFGVKMMQ